MSITTLKQFYDFMLSAKLVKQQIFDLFITSDIRKIECLGLIDKLKEFLLVLENIEKSKSPGKYRLLISEGRYIDIDLCYEIGELKKDIYFLTHSEDEFLKYLGSLHDGFSVSVDELAEFFGDMRFRNFITDRDGTVNNYCGRYASSIQSVYNAVFLYRFSVNCTDNSVLLTSAPLDNIGMYDISLMPRDAFIYAGSKGREYFDKNGNRHQLDIDYKKQQTLDILNRELNLLLKNPEYEVFTLIGSGLQFKFGQTTIARQDISNTVDIEKSDRFLNMVKEMVKKIDPDDRFFRIEDTGKDIEILLTIEDKNPGGQLKDFDKGDSVDFLDEQLRLGVAQGPNLICGDTLSDIAMVRAAVSKNPENTRAVFVTKDRELKNKVSSVCEKVFFADTPDILVFALNMVSNNRKG